MKSVAHYIFFHLQAYMLFIKEPAPIVATATGAL